MNVDGSDMKRLTDHGMDSSWSPDDLQIAFASNRENKKVFQIYAINADGSSVRRLTNHKSEDSNPAWAPAQPSHIFPKPRATAADFF